LIYLNAKRGNDASTPAMKERLGRLISANQELVARAQQTRENSRALIERSRALIQISGGRLATAKRLAVVIPAGELSGSGEEGP
jgi:hypothetical protein